MFREYFPGICIKVLINRNQSQISAAESGRRHYGLKHLEDLKSNLEKYIFPDPFGKNFLSEISIGNVNNLQQRLARKYPDIPATINKTMKHIDAIFSEGYLREDIKYNPALQLSEIPYKPKERGCFTADEISAIFADSSRWHSDLAYQVFMFAAFTCRRASEILIVKWEQIDGKYCDIDRAWRPALNCCLWNLRRCRGRRWLG